MSDPSISHRNIHVLRDNQTGTSARPERRRLLSKTDLRIIASYLLWPLLIAGAISVNYVGMKTAYPILYFNGSYFLLAAAVCVLERIMPHERQWLADDRQLVPDLCHTLLSKSAVQALILGIAATG